jgi:hypothetical protein
MTKLNTEVVREPRGHGSRRVMLVEIVQALVLVVGAANCAAQAVPPKSAAPDMKIGAKEFPDTDAVILRWEQQWTLDKDGTVRRRDHQWTKLLNHRAIGRFGDQRVDFCEGQDKLTIHTAQTILPNGEVLPVPKYSFNLAAPEDVGGWPEYAGWQQQVICFSGIEDGCVIELDYEVATKPGQIPWLQGDVRVNDDYPIVERIVAASVPEGTELRSQVDGVAASAGQPEKAPSGGLVTYRWTFKDLAAAPGEAQSLRWEKRSPRLRFTTCKNAEEWVGTMLKRVEAAAQPDEKIKKFAEAAVEREQDPAERVRKVAGKLKDSFTVVDSPRAMRSLNCRNAADVLQADYGNPLEAAALCVAAIRALGMDANAEVAADVAAWDEKVPTLSAFAGAVAVVDLPGGPVRVSPQQGLLRDPGAWGRRCLLAMDKSGAIQKTYIHARGEERPSEIDISGKVTIDKDGKATGDLLIRLTGVFYDPANLETAASQEALVKNVVGRALNGATLKSHSIATLSDDVLRAKASVAWTEALKNYDKRYILRLGDGPAFLPEVPLPLGKTTRRTDVQLAGRFNEDVDLVIELPEGWTSPVMPVAQEEVKQPWGTAKQSVTVDGKFIRFHRCFTVTADTIAAKDFAGLRDVVNTLRADAAKMLVTAAGKEEPKKEPEKKVER